MRNMRQFWSPRRIGEDRVTMVRLGPLRLWMARAEKEWGLAYEHGEVSDVLDISQIPEDVVPQKLSWTTTLFEQAPREFVLQPTVPDRPVVVKPTYPVLIPKSERGTFFCLLPVFVKIVLSTGEVDTELMTLPSRKLSDTWFGTPTEGEFCYSLPMPAERDQADMSALPHHIVCPLEIHNQSAEVLKIEKLCFRPRYIGIYCGDSHLWSTRVVMQYEGSYKGTTVRYLNLPPEEESNLVQLAKPLKREERGLSRLTFGSGFGKDLTFGK